MGLGGWLTGGEGLGSRVGTVLMVGAGAALVAVSLSDVREAVRGAPVSVTCQAFVDAPLQVGRWVSVTGCRLDLALATTRRWKGFMPARADAGTSRGHFMELFLPVAPLGVPAGTLSPVVLATKEPALLKLMDELMALPDEAQVDAFIDAHQHELEVTLAPPALTGYVEPLGPWGNRAALREMGAPGAVVLEQGREPARANAAVGLLVGMALLVWGLMPVARRVLLLRERGVR